MEVQRGQYSTRDSAAIDPHDGLEVTVEQLAVGTRQGLQWFAGVENFVMTGQTEVQLQTEEKLCVFSSIKVLLLNTSPEMV